MNITIAFPGKKIRPPESSWVDEYIKRSNSYAKVSIQYVPEPKEKLGINSISSLIKEPSSILISLDVGGRQYSTEEFSHLLQQANSKKICFLIGPAYGISSDVIHASKYTLSLSKMTLPHRLALVLLSEQIYRALSFAHGHPYHHKD